MELEKGLFKNYDESLIISWARQLQLFRFCKENLSPRGDPWVGDSFKAKLRSEDEEELTQILSLLGMVKSHDLEKLIAGFLLGLWPLPKTTPRVCLALFEPGYCIVNGAGVTIHMTERHGYIDVNLAIKATSAPLSFSDFFAAQDVEAAIQPLAKYVIDPPQDDSLCFCPRYYPQFWE